MQQLHWMTRIIGMTLQTSTRLPQGMLVTLLHTHANRAKVEALYFLDDRSKEMQTLSSYSNVCSMFLEYNTSLPSSAWVERLFSTGGLIRTPRRNELSNAVFQQLIMLTDKCVCHKYATLADFIACRTIGFVAVSNINLTPYRPTWWLSSVSSHSLFVFHGHSGNDFDF